MPDASSAALPAPQASLLPLEISALCYRAEREWLLENIDVTISSKGITAIMGPNGAGKSLLLRLVHGLLTPSSGHILWNGQELDIITRQRQALVFQKPVLMRRSVAANIEFVLKSRGKQRRQQRDRILQQAGLSRQKGGYARSLARLECRVRHILEQVGPSVKALNTPSEVNLGQLSSMSKAGAHVRELKGIALQGVKVVGVGTLSQHPDQMKSPGGVFE